MAPGIPSVTRALSRAAIWGSSPPDPAPFRSAHRAGAHAGKRIARSGTRRSDSGATYYAAFVFDPDGHKLEAQRE